MGNIVCVDNKNYNTVKHIFKEKEELEEKNRKSLHWLSKLTIAKQ